MNQSSKQAVNRTRNRVRLINFNDSIIEGYVFVSYGQRITDLLNDDRGFIPVESASGEVKVISKRAIMEIEILETPVEVENERGSSDKNVVNMISGNAYDILGVSIGADDGVVRAVYLDRIKSVDPGLVAGMTSNPDLIAAAQALRNRYDAAYDAISHTRQIEAIAAAVKAAQPKRKKFGAS